MLLKEYGSWYILRVKNYIQNRIYYYQESKGGPPRTAMLLLGQAGWYQDIQDVTVSTGSAGPQDRQEGMF
jgi:hypothetical protein